MTVLQELIKEQEKIRREVVDHPHIKPFVRTAKLKEIDNILKSLSLGIEKERQQIINAYEAGNRKGYNEHILSEMSELNEEYYTKL